MLGEILLPPKGLISLNPCSLEIKKTENTLLDTVTLKPYEIVLLADR